MTDNAEQQPDGPVFPQYPPPSGVTIADPKQAKPLMKMINKMLRPRPVPRTRPVSRVRKPVDSPRRPKDKGY